jgi:uncharacterized lipoprotein YddW (UPF0748 family)
VTRSRAFLALVALTVAGGCRHGVGRANPPAAPAPNAPPVTGTLPSSPATPPATPSTGAAPKPTPPVRVISDTPPIIAREFRGVWVASVANIDWPSSRHLSTDEQQRELIALLDRVVALKLNAVIFQVRPAADALYASKLEPWSEYLTGTQGKAPDPFWDPLAFAVKEAHARNLELHAWFNPYRARHTDAKSPLASSHIARTNPSLVKTYAGYLWMDPGEPAVRTRTLRVVLDVVKRYDIDGVHLDDYFYPYPETKRGVVLPFPDDKSWKRYRKAGGALDRGDWRRANVDSLIRELDRGIHKAKPWVKFGISPFGIWRPGFPTQVKGFDSYDKLYADSRKWIREGWGDYFTPQLYWPTTKVEQAYPALLAWWADENTLGRHLWPGNFTSRAGGTGGGAFPVSELVEQIRVTRQQPGATGNVHFSMKSFLINQASMNDSLVVGPYAELALVPATPWLKVADAPIPTASISLTDPAGPLLLRVVGKGEPWQWLVRLRTDTGWVSVVLPGATKSFPVPTNPSATVISVTALNRAGAESPPVILRLPAARTSTPAPAKRGRAYED